MSVTTIHGAACILVERHDPDSIWITIVGESLDVLRIHAPRNQQWDADEFTLLSLEAYRPDPATDEHKRADERDRKRAVEGTL